MLRNCFQNFFFLRIDKDIHKNSEKIRLYALKRDENYLQFNLNLQYIWQKIQKLKKILFFEIFNFLANIL